MEGSQSSRWRRAKRAGGRRKMPAWKKLCFAAITVTTPLIVTELVLRLFAPQGVQTNIEEALAGHEKVPWGIAVSGRWETWHAEFGRVTTETNSEGIVDRTERSVEKPPGTARVLLLGDSFTEGWGLRYEQTFGYLLEEKLDSVYGDSAFDVIKAGIRGFNTADEANVFEAKWMAYAPDIVVVFLLLNDVCVNPPLAEGIPLEKRMDSDAMRRLGPTAPGESLVHHVELLCGLRRLLMASDALYSRLFLAFRPQVSFFMRPFSESVDEQYRRTVDHLERLQRLCEQIDAELYVVFLPQRIQVLAARQPLEGFDPFLLARAVGKELDEIGVPHFDLLPVFAAYRPQDLYFTTDGHTTHVGSALVANELLCYLLARSPALHGAYVRRGPAVRHSVQSTVRLEDAE